ncbi:MAG TPA: hypothetical protein VJ732_11685 [Bryobacteraceae bacterium]|nr:hypothetical protein [Bryobacteraceae bacterium]
MAGYSRGAVLLAIAVSGFAMRAGAQERLPRFAEYRATEIFKGKPAAPVLRTHEDRLFRTRIREAAAKGPNFAGHLTIAEWGCGAGCVSIAVIDARTGAVSRAPFHVLAASGAAPLRYADGTADTDLSFEPLEYMPDSRMLLARGCPEEKDCASYYYEWAGTVFRLIQKVPPAPVQP